MIEDLLKLDRDSMICLSILLGCDYLPCGVSGVGKEKALKLLELWRDQGRGKPTKILKSWTVASSKETYDSLPTQNSSKSKNRYFLNKFY